MEIREILEPCIKDALSARESSSCLKSHVGER